MKTKIKIDFKICISVPIPLEYVYRNNIEICLTPNHLLFGRQLLHSFNTTSTVTTKLTVLSVIIFGTGEDMNV